MNHKILLSSLVVLAFLTACNEENEKTETTSSVTDANLERNANAVLQAKEAMNALNVKVEAKTKASEEVK